MNLMQSLHCVALACCWIVVIAITLRVPARATVAMERIDQFQAKIDRLKANTENSTEQLQKVKEEQAEIEKVLPVLISRAGELKARIAEARTLSGPRLWVVSDRWSPGDKAFVAHVSNPEVAIIRSGNPHAVAWQAGRRCLLWGSTARQASERFAARFPPSRGWMISPVEEVKLERRLMMS
jgi:TolA-binding protein